MSRPLFPFVLLGDRTIETVGDTMPEVQAMERDAIDTRRVVRDFRPIDHDKKPVPPAPGPRIPEQRTEVVEPPKVSSATGDATSLPSESPTSPVESGEKNADAERGSKTLDNSDSSPVSESPVTTGSDTPPAMESAPQSSETQISSFPLL